LQSAQLEQMVDAIFVVLNVAVEHRRIGFQTNLVRSLRRVEPLIAIDLVIADNVPHPVCKYFCAAAG
jgi:hypothetical protein